MWTNKYETSLWTEKVFPVSCYNQREGENVLAREFTLDNLSLFLSSNKCLEQRE